MRRMRQRRAAEQILDGSRPHNLAEHRADRVRCAVEPGGPFHAVDDTIEDGG
jgi:hypothetical protein